VDELKVDALVEAVLARNPTLAQMTAAWQAASARYPQAMSLDDPMLNAGIGPGTIGSRELNFAYRLEIAQKYPWPGKLDLRGENALAEAGAAAHDVDDARLQLVESTRTAFYDYYLVARALEVNEEALRLLGEFRENALARFRTGQAPQQDVLQADVEIGRTRERKLTLERMRRVAIARINTLMHLPTGTPLPPPPKEAPLPDDLPDVEQLQARAVASRPDLQALSDRIAAEAAALALAHKEFYPDFEPYFMWDRFMGNRDVEMAPQIGVKLNLPVRKERRYGAVGEARARLVQRQAELARQTDQVNLQVEEAYQMVRESERAVELYDETILPAARQNVEAAIPAYATGKIPFLSLIEAQRDLIELRDRYYETTADVFRRRATLSRVVGGEW
jgi:outer membrane protein TolC